MFESIANLASPNWRLRIALLLLLAAHAVAFIFVWRMTHMPLRSYNGSLPVLSPAQSDLAARLANHVTTLSRTIGERNGDREGSLQASTDYFRRIPAEAGYAVIDQTYMADGRTVANVEAELPGDAGESVIVVGAHYDSVEGTVGADDNASGVAATLELARMLRGNKLHKTLRFVLFVNEEPPYFQTEEMGSLVYASTLRRSGTRASGMISLEMLGFYSNQRGSQKYPAPLSLFYPNRGNFIAFVGNGESRDLVRRAVRAFRESAQFPSEGIAAPGSWPGIGWSDHWSFWQQNYPAIMVTDTAFFRNPYYHTRLDTPGKLDFDRMARVVDGVRHVVESLAHE